MTHYYRKKRYTKKKHLFKNDKKIWIKFFFLIFLSIIFLCMQSIWKDSEELKEYPTHKIHIAIDVDNNYIYACIVYLTSLLNNRAKSTFYTIHVLSSDRFSKDHINKIKIVVENFGKNHSEILFYNLGNDFAGAPVSCFATASYYRIALPSLLPNIDRIIYTDLDSVNLKDLTEFYNIQFQKDMYIAAVLDRVGMLKELEVFGIKPKKYINAGVLLMDLKTMRENSIEKKLRDFIATHDIKTVDQTAINAVCHNNIQILPYKYAVFQIYEDLVEINKAQDSMYRVSESELYEAFHNTAILHYPGPNKPWNKNFQYYSRAYWWYYAKMSGFYNDILNYYRYDDKYVEDILKQIPDDGGLLKRNYKKFKL